MPIRKDLIAHAVMGLLVVAYLVGGYLWLLPLAGPGLTVAVMGTLAAIAVELYQKLRNEGTADWLDAAFMAAPGWLCWAALHFTNWRFAP